MNATASFAVMHALKALEERAINKREDCPVSVPTQKELLAWGEAAASFLGVKRRFELIGQSKNIAVFDDFAHHPTAIATTLEAFRAYVTSAQRPGRLIACFDPRNATMRRSVLQEQLAGSFSSADVVFLGKVPVDLRLKEDEALNGAKVAALIGQKATYFPDNDLLLETLLESVRPGDTVVFMSSGSFDGLPRKLHSSLEGA
jgi:UDP-N-acetylmuramate: L-alanyl-gamma-D-glutamyl-meso-diaminopimelate ligase